MHGFENNPATIIIQSNDTLRSKPFSRIRYYQASNDEGFIDASFSARVLSKLMLGFRITNNSIEENYDNTEFGSWKANIKGIYKLSDSLFVSMNFYHLKLNTSLNGGVDIESIVNSTSTLTGDIFTAQSPVVHSDMKSTTTLNNISTSIYGNILPLGYSTASIFYNHNNRIFKRSTTDSVNINYKDLYDLLGAKIDHSIKLGNLTTNISAGYEQIQFNNESIDNNKKYSNYYSSLIGSYNLLNGMIKPTLFGKLSEYYSQNNNGIGFDIGFIPYESTKLLIGMSNFNKPLSIIESEYLPNDKKQNYSTIFASMEFNTNFTNSSASYFSIESSNTPIPVFNSSDVTNSNTKIIFTDRENTSIKGLNLNSNLKFWKILTIVNFNYYWENKDSKFSNDSKYSLTTGLYYVDTLYNSNLDLKTGITLYLNDNFCH